MWLLAAAFMGVAAFLTWHLHGSEFIPFFYDWGGLYDRGIIDGSEWRANRFRFL